MYCAGDTSCWRQCAHHRRSRTFLCNTPRHFLPHFHALVQTYNFITSHHVRSCIQLPWVHRAKVTDDTHTLAECHRRFFQRHSMRPAANPSRLLSFLRSSLCSCFLISMAAPAVPTPLPLTPAPAMALTPHAPPSTAALHAARQNLRSQLASKAL